MTVRDDVYVNALGSQADYRGLTVTVVAALAVVLGAPVTTALARNIPYSTASAHVVQAQRAPGTCHSSGSGLYSKPDAGCTPGALNPAVTQTTIPSTICRSGWTSTVRPPESISEREKFASMNAYGDERGPSAYEYDHLVPLELGGAVNDPRNLWPEPDYSVRAGFYLNPKDRLEGALRRLVCGGRMSLATAQRLIATDWVSAFYIYG